MLWSLLVDQQRTIKKLEDGIERGRRKEQASVERRKERAEYGKGKSKGRIREEQIFVQKGISNSETDY